MLQPPAAHHDLAEENHHAHHQHANQTKARANSEAHVSFLLGDSNADGVVNAGDALQTRNRSGQATDANNFRSDLNADGVVNSGDTLIVRSRSGTALP